MTTPDLYVAGRRLELGKRIGKGGEGEVYLLAGEPERALKVYTGNLDLNREGKVKAMVSLGLAKTSSLVAFPEEIVNRKSGEFAGFKMRLVEGFRAIHELYGIKSRKIHYVGADYRFLVRAAANTARAIGQVHASPCVIGDLNHSGILVARNATVALIDADSFQFQANSRLYPCLVGVPDFTPPELHGASLNGVIRTKIHDRFGLAVAIFQLLFMGRHPYAGRGGGDLTLEQLIARNLFAYSRTRATGVAPPAAMVTLDDFPTEIAAAFERAFGLDPTRRPSPEEWISLLQGMESRLSRCASHPMHFYPTAGKGCPWCRMEAGSSVVLFVASIIGPMGDILGAGSSDFDVEKLWAAIRVMTVPDPQGLLPKLPHLPLAPMEEARDEKLRIEREKRRVPSQKLGAAALFAAFVALWIAVPSAAALWVFGLGYASYLWAKRDEGKFEVVTAAWKARYAEADERWEEALDGWRNSLGIAPIQSLRRDLEQAVDDYRRINSQKFQAIDRLKREHQSRQLNSFLDRFLIKNASIPGIGPAKTVTLASFGIELAADVTQSAVENVPGFGSTTAMKLLKWRATQELRFVYNPTQIPQDLQEQARIQAEFNAKAAKAARRISSGQAELAQLVRGFRQRLTAEDHQIVAIASRRAQLDVSLAYLGIEKPHNSRASSPSPRQANAYNASSSPASSSAQPLRHGQMPSGGNVKCPQCGAVMVHRVARHGSRAGRSFWGCSKFPQCRGTRN